MSKYSISVDVDVDLDEFDDDDIIDYLEEEGYTVIHSAANASESAGGLDEEESDDRYQNARMAIKNITKVCQKYEGYCTRSIRNSSHQSSTFHHTLTQRC